MTWLILAAIVVLPLIAYSNSLNNPLFFDDVPSIETNESIRQLWPLSRLLEVEQGDPFAGRPLVSLSFAINYYFTQLSLPPMHLTNLALHIVNGLLVFLLCRETFRMPAISEQIREQAVPLAGIIATLWTVHPLQTEVIDYLTQRTEIFLGLFYLLTFLSARLAWEKPKIWGPVAMIACWVGVLCKESIVTAPFLVVLYDIVLSQLPFKELLRKRGVLWAGLFSSWIMIAIVMAYDPRGATAGFGLGITAWQYLQTQCWCIGRYLTLVIWPDQLLIDYGKVPMVTPESTSFGLLLILALLLTALGTVWKWPTVSLAIFSCFVILSPTSSFVPIVTEVGAERRMYLPLLPLVMLLVVLASVAFNKLVRLSPPQKTWTAAILTGAIVLLLMFLTWERNKDYHDTASLWRGAMKLHPDNGRAVYNLIIRLNAKDQYQKSVEYADEFLSDNIRAEWTTSAEVWMQRGLSLMELGQLDAAVASFRKALELKPDYPYALSNLGMIISRRNPREAIPLLERAAKLMPHLVPAWVNLGDANAKLGNFSRAQECYLEALELEPDHEFASQNLKIVRDAEEKVKRLKAEAAGK
ncbi:tetratricopeptide repeat protein [Calycomorphotria hydatis]|nr:tetratricopeptide repeat protein [Calycomorphotria hydatis]